MPTLHQIQHALQRCLAAEPPVESALSPDASHLAEVFGAMLYLKQQTRELEAFSFEQLAAFDRWKSV